jgi:endoglucanase
MKIQWVVMVGLMGASASCGLGLSPSDQSQTKGTTPTSTTTSATTPVPSGKPAPGPSSDTTPNPNVTPVPATTPTPTGFAAHYTFMGRFDFSDPNGPRFAWPQSEIGANFSGTSLTVLLNEPVNQLYNDAPVDNYYDVYVDNSAPVQVAVSHSTTVYPISTTLADTNHTVWISKRTEANIGEGQFLGLKLGSGTLLAPPPVRPRAIEFIGDSASSGYGADGNYPVWNGCTFSADTADADVAYPKLTADALNAQGINLAFAGKGITRNLSDQDPVNTMPVIYPFVDPSTPSLPYQFTQYTADVVVINIGGNDWTGTSGSGTPPDQTLFISKYMSLLQQIRAHYPKSVILVCLTALAQNNDRVTLREYIQAVQTTASATMPNVYYFEFPEYDGALGFGCDAHPDSPAHALMAQELVTAIKSHTGW